MVHTNLKSKYITKSEKSKIIVGRVLTYIFLVVLAVVFAFPFFFMVCRGLMSTTWFNDVNMHIIPDRLVFSNFTNAFGVGGYGMPLLNSLWLCALNAIIIPLTSIIPAYAFVRLKWIGKKFVFAIMMATAMLPGVITQVPQYVMYHSFGMLNTYYPLILPNLLFGGAMNVFLARQFLITHPAEIYESATIDGAGPFKAFFYIALPLCKTIFIYVAVTVFMGCWGDYYTPSIFLKNLETKNVTFAYALYRNLWSNENNIHPEYVFSACTIISIVPVACYAIFQKYLIQGIASVGIKG